MFAPESCGVAVNIVAGAFITLSMGIAGYTRFGVKAPGIDLSASRGTGDPN